eukprot:Gb_20402 [translate_table: standard]
MHPPQPSWIPLFHSSKLVYEAINHLFTLRLMLILQFRHGKQCIHFNPTGTRACKGCCSMEGVASLVYYKTISETQFFRMYAKLCVHLTMVAPQFPSDEPNGNIESFRRILLNLCQTEFEGAYELNAETKPLTAPEQAVESNSKLRFLANIPLMGEIFKQKVISEKIVHHCIQINPCRIIDAMFSLFH